MDKHLKIGILGVGHLGKIHLKCLAQTPFELVGFYDPDKNLQDKISEEFGIKCFESEEALIGACDAIDIVSTTITHYELAKKAISKKKHVFLEKPVCHDVQQAIELETLVSQKNVKLQVGHVERYNPAIVALKDKNISPMFIEGHRLTTFNTRGNDVSVVYDLMIHDLDLVLQLVDSEIKDVQANGVSVINDTPDICNARITFENGCVANLTASRISMKKLRKLRLFQSQEYISLDFLKKETQIISIEDLGDKDPNAHMTMETNSGTKILSIEMPEIIENNAIVDELNDFHNAILTNSPPKVDITAGRRALELAQTISDAISQ